MRAPSSSLTSQDTDTNSNDINLCRNDANRHMVCSKSLSNASSKKADDHVNTPLWKVGKILMDSLNKGKMRRSKIFGTPLEDLPLNCQGMPKIVQRLCLHLEQYGLNEPELFSNSKKQSKLVERLKISFDRAGDAVLENCVGTDVCVVAELLKLWLCNLPHPLIPNSITSRLRGSIERHERKEIRDLNAEFCNILITCSALNLGVLYTVIHLLYEYVTKWYSSMHVNQLPEMFAKILIGSSDIVYVEIISTLLYNFHKIFNERVLERAFKLYIMRDKRSRIENRKCNRIECGLSPLSVDKLPRSNSEEKLSIHNDCNQNVKMENLNMRRVNSHEDFSGHTDHNLCRSLQISNTSHGQGSTWNDYILTKHRFEQCDEPVLDNFQRMMHASDKETEVLLAPPPFHYNSDSRIQEEIRNAERFSPQFNSYRSNGRRKRSHQGFNIKPKMRSVLKNTLDDLVITDDSTDDYDLTDIYDYPTKLDWCRDYDTHSTSSTSSNSSSESKSPDRRSVKTQSDSSVDYRNSHNCNSYNRYPYSESNQEKNVISPVLHLSYVDSKILHVNKQLQWVKKSMKRFERDFENKFGEAPTMMNKMSHPEYKHMMATIIYLKNNLKQLRKEANDSFFAHRSLGNNNPSISHLNTFVSTKEKELIFQETEKRLRDKRLATERPECVEQMHHEQLQDEKVSIQKELLNLENTFGPTAARSEEIFRPIYERYRIVKRFIARSTIALKFRESVSSELATIDENETMDFDSSPASTTVSLESADTPSPCQLTCNISKSDFPLENIRELSSTELMMEYKTTKEEKKKLRDRIYMFEQEVENRTINDSKHCIHSLRCRYKNIKAKLKLLEALLTKTK